MASRAAGAMVDFDLRVLGRQPGLGGLKQVVQPGQAHHGDVLVPALLERRLDDRQVLLGKHLQVELARRGPGRGSAPWPARAPGRGGRRTASTATPIAAPAQPRPLSSRREWRSIRSATRAIDVSSRRIAKICFCRSVFAVIAASGAPLAFMMAAACASMICVAGDARPAQHDDERNLRVSGGQHGRDEPALAVPEQPDALGVDLGSHAERLPRGPRVAGEVLARRRRESAGRLAHAAVVVPQHGDAAPREVVREHEERLVAEDLLIAVLRRRCP